MNDPNARTDYNKMKKLLQLDKLDGDRKGVLILIPLDTAVIHTKYCSHPIRVLESSMVKD